MPNRVLRLVAIVGVAVLLGATIVTAYSEGLLDLTTLRANAQKLGVDISRLSPADASAAVQKAGDEYNRTQPQVSPEEAEWQYLNMTAAKLGISVAGLTIPEAKAAIEQANAEWAAKQPQVTPEEAEWQYVNMTASKLGVSVDGMTLDQAKAAIKAAEKSR